MAALAEGPGGCPPYFGYKRRNYKIMKSHQGKQTPPPPPPSRPQPPKFMVWICPCQQTKKQRIMIYIVQTCIEVSLN